METFYRVVLENSGEDYFFKTYEDAAAFLLEGYFDDFSPEEESEIINTNTFLADNKYIEGYGWITEENFED